MSLKRVDEFDSSAWDVINYNLYVVNKNHKKYITAIGFNYSCEKPIKIKQKKNRLHFGKVYIINLNYNKLEMYKHKVDLNKMLILI